LCAFVTLNKKITYLLTYLLILKSISEFSFVWPGVWLMASRRMGGQTDGRAA